MLCKYLSDFYLFLLIALLAFFLCRFLLVACLANRIAALRTVARSSAWLLWESKYLAVFKFFLSKLDRRRQSDYPRVGLRERLEAVLSYVLCFESLAIFHANAHSTLLLPTVQSLCELRLLIEDGLGVTHYLFGCRKHFIVQGGKSPGRLVEPGAKRNDKE